jgi:hypothetical protein
MSVIEHLEALRRALLVSLVAWAVTTVIALVIAGRVIGLLVARAGIGHAIFLAPAGGVLLQLKVAIYIGLVLAAPVVIQQIWWFVSPGLHAHERRLVMPLVIATIVFFAMGVAVAIFALPIYTERQLSPGHQPAGQLRADHGHRLRPGVRAPRGAFRAGHAPHHQLQMAAQDSALLVPRPGHPRQLSDPRC